MNCGGYLFKLARVTAGPGLAEPGFALKGNRPEAWPFSPRLASKPLGGLWGLVFGFFQRGPQASGTAVG